mmetsp:Transcript_128099/g.362630  ORF Transcript_128099/g.362630 Transcript_128099/m.362630 type:complete len:276 (-) Transcript_128099:285-1112(-)
MLWKVRPMTSLSVSSPPKSFMKHRPMAAFTAQFRRAGSPPFRTPPKTSGPIASSAKLLYAEMVPQNVDWNFPERMASADEPLDCRREFAAWWLPTTARAITLLVTVAQLMPQACSAGTSVDVRSETRHAAMAITQPTSRLPTSALWYDSKMTLASKNAAIAKWQAFGLPQTASKAAPQQDCIVHSTVLAPRPNRIGPPKRLAIEKIAALWCIRETDTSTAPGNVVRQRQKPSLTAVAVSSSDAGLQSPPVLQDCLAYAAAAPATKVPIRLHRIIP